MLSPLQDVSKDVSYRKRAQAALTIGGEQGASGVTPDDDIPALLVHSQRVQTFRRGTTELPPANN